MDTKVGGGMYSMEVRKELGQVNIIFEEDDLYIEVEAGEVYDEETGTDLGIIEVCETFNISQFGEAIKFYIETKEKYPDAKLKIISKSENPHSALLYVGNKTRFLSIQVNTDELESDLIRKFEKIKEILEDS